MRILIVKLSSLGDVVHAMPVVNDIIRAHRDAEIDWVVEPGFAPLVRRVRGVATVIECPLRRWRSAWWRADTWRELRAFRAQMALRRYDAIIDLQGLTKSAWVARMAQGPRWGLAQATEGSSHEAPARWWADHAVTIQPRRIHALDRSRQLVGHALGVAPLGRPRFGLVAHPRDPDPTRPPMVVFVHGTSRDDKRWPHEHWVALGRRVLAAGWRIGLPWGNEAEHTRAELMAADLQFQLDPLVEVWPAMTLDKLVDRIGEARGVIGVDSGLSHIAVALNLPHVQIYRFPTAWRTGPLPAHGHRHQVSVEAQPLPSVDAVWLAWQQVAPVAGVVSRTATGFGAVEGGVDGRQNSGRDSGHASDDDSGQDGVTPISGLPRRHAQ
jgi:heptosyltransferase I